MSNGGGVAKSGYRTELPEDPDETDHRPDQGALPDFGGVLPVKNAELEHGSAVRCIRCSFTGPIGKSGSDMTAVTSDGS